MIIGGGLAGSSTALHLSKKGFSVLIIEKSKCRRYIPCAGGMASSMKKYLPLKIDQAIETEVNSVHFTWKSGDYVKADLSGESPFLILKREYLDDLLVNEAINHGTKLLVSSTVSQINKENETWIIKCENTNSFKSKFLVIADGSESQWSQYLNLGPPKPKFAQTIAIRLKGSGNISKNSARFEFGSVNCGFAWAFPLKESVNIGLGSFLGNYRLDDKSLNNQIIKNFGFDINNIELNHKKLRIWSGFYNLHNKNAIAVGDAASLCDPFLAEGIRPSLLSAYYAAECIEECLNTNTYDLKKYSKIMTKKWSNSMVWGKRIAEVFYRFPRTGYKLGVKRKTAPQRIAQILSGEMSYSDIARRVIKRFLFQ